MHIADANGEYQEIVLPATCDSFVISAPVGNNVQVKVLKAEWNPTKGDKILAALTEKFPELAELNKGDKLTQGGELPLMVSPANMDLSKGYAFKLVDVKGKTVDIEVNNPTAGISEEWNVLDDGYMSRSAEAKDGLWTLSVVPAYDKKKYYGGYASVSKASLIATNAKGVSSRTTFVYDVYVKSAEDASIDTNGGRDEEGNYYAYAPYAESVDLLAKFTNEGSEHNAPIDFVNEYEGKYLIELTNDLHIEKYGLSIAEDGHTLNIANMPADMNEISLNLKVSTVGLNGSTISGTVRLTVKQTVAVNGELEAKSLELNGKDQIVKWSISELGMTAVELDKVLSTDLYANISYEWTDEDGIEHSENPSVGLVYYNKDGKKTSYEGDGNWSNGAATEFGFTVNAATNHEWIAPAEYTVKFQAGNNPVIYSAETT